MPNLTDVAPFRLVPVMVTVVPPEADPLVGVKVVMVGTDSGAAGTTAAESDDAGLVPPPLIATTLNR